MGVVGRNLHEAFSEARSARTRGDKQACQNGNLGPVSIAQFLPKGNGYIAAVGAAHGDVPDDTPLNTPSAVGFPAALVRIQSKWDETMGACELSVSPPLLRIMTADRAERS